MAEQTNEHVYLSPAAYDEVKAALKVRRFHFGRNGHIGGAHVRFLGMFWKACSKREAERLNRKERKNGNS